MKIAQSFVVAQPVVVVWAFFKDVPKVAECLPGAEYAGTRENGVLLGKVSAKVGPFQASFEGEAQVQYDEAARSIVFEGKGLDRKGASRGRMTMICRLTAEATTTSVAVEADVQLSGTIAQFGRTGIITEIANQMVADFVRNAERHLATPATPAVAPASGAVARDAEMDRKPLNFLGLLWAVVKTRLRAWLHPGRRASPKLLQRSHGQESP